MSKEKSQELKGKLIFRPLACLFALFIALVWAIYIKNCYCLSNNEEIPFQLFSFAGRAFSKLSRPTTLT